MLFLFVAHQVLVFAARELSSPVSDKRDASVGVAATGSSDLSPYVNDKPVDWRQEVEKRIQSKTRRLRKVAAAGGHLYRAFVFIWVKLFSHFSCVSGGDTTCSRGHPKPLCSCGWTLLFPFAEELWQVCSQQLRSTPLSFSAFLFFNILYIMIYIPLC